VIGEHGQLRSDPDQCPIRLRLGNIGCGQAGARIEAVHAEIRRVHPER